MEILQREDIYSLLDPPQINGVPKIIHQIWIDKRENLDCHNYQGPVKYLEKIATIKEHHPQWRHVHWNNQSVEYLLTLKEVKRWSKYYYQCRHPVQRADIARLIILIFCGGIYVDLDFRFYSNIEPLLAKMTTEEALMFHHLSPEVNYKVERDIVCNGILISRKSTTIWKGIMRMFIKKLAYYDANLEVLNLTGPVMIHEYLYGNDGYQERPIWKIKEYNGENKSRVNNLPVETMMIYCNHDGHSDSTGWHISLINQNVYYYGKIIVILFLIFIFLILFFYLILFYQPKRWEMFIAEVRCDNLFKEKCG